MLRIYGLILIVVIITIVVIMTSPAFYNPWPALYGFLVISEDPRTSDVIIALSGGPGRDIYAAELYKAGLSRRIIMSGISPSAGQMAERAVVMGVKREDIILEERSVSTFQNALFTREIMVGKGFQSAIVVSSPYHMRRTKMVFERVFKGSGVRLIYCAAPPGLDINTPLGAEYARRTVIMEYIKLLYYWARY
ncbi:YdcF family protein [Pelotomaculum propionicicum]|uniref:YdcF family protein n=1 Tax=Pelotomaculum propionicicum TaxID=258475 RepID=UPI003B7D79DB